MSSPDVVLRRGADRPVSGGGGITSRHGLSFGAHYDPARTSFGALVAHNDDRLEPGVSYGAHTHEDVEILTWVLSGAMAHLGPTGRRDVVEPGVLQVLSAGSGWRHDEQCDGESPVHLLQIWIAPGLDDPPASAPSLTHVPVDLTDGPVSPVALRRADTTITVHRLAAGSTWAVPDARWRHVHVARGGLDGPVAAGDSLEVTGAGAFPVRAGGQGAEVLVVATA